MCHKPPFSIQIDSNDSLNFFFNTTRLARINIPFAFLDLIQIISLDQESECVCVCTKKESS